MFWTTAFCAALLGLISGILISHAGDIGTDWFKPEVLGPTVGACFAALIGLAGAAWVHDRTEGNRRKERFEVEKRATGKVFGTTLELYATLSFFRDELRRAVAVGRIRPHVIIAVQNATSAAVVDLSYFANDPAVHHRITAIAKNTARATPSMPNAVTFPSKVLEQLKPMGEIPVAPIDRSVFHQALDVLDRAMETVMSFLEEIESTYSIMEVPPSEVRHNIEARIRELAAAFTPMFR